LESVLWAMQLIKPQDRSERRPHIWTWTLVSIRYSLIFLVIGMFEKGSYNFYPLASHCNPDLSLCSSKDSWFEPQFPGLCKYLITLAGAKVNVMRRHFKGRECQYCNVYCFMNTAIRQILKQGLWQDQQSRGVVLFCYCPYPKFISSSQCLWAKTWMKRDKALWQSKGMNASIMCTYDELNKISCFVSFFLLFCPGF
jgi:hypothetical protein